MNPLRAATGALVLGTPDGSVRLEPGFEPRALVLWWAAAADGVARGNAGGIGFAAGDTSAAVAWASADAAEPTASATATDRTALLGVDPASKAAVTRGEVAGTALRWSGAAPGSTVHWLALAGDAITRARAGHTAGRVRLGFRPALVLVAPTSSGAGLLAGLGAATAGAQVGTSYRSADGMPESDVAGVQLAGAAVVIPADRNTIEAAEPVRFHDDGFEVGREVVYLALGGGLVCRVGTAASPRRPARGRVRRVGFRPDALLLFTWGLSAREQPSDIGRLSIGAATAVAQGSAGWDDRDVPVRPTSTHSRSSTREAVVVANTQTGGIHASASVASLDVDGFTLDWAVSDGPARQVAYVALAGRRPGRLAKLLGVVSRLVPDTRPRVLDVPETPAVAGDAVEDPEAH
jgi:hypothetical protein